MIDIDSLKFEYAVDYDINLEKFVSEMLPIQYSEKEYLWEYGMPNGLLCQLKNEDDEVFGTQGMIPVELNLKGENLYTYKSETSYLSEKLRGTGMFQRMYNDIVEKTRSTNAFFIWGFTKLGKVWEKMGFKVKNESLMVASLRVHSGLQSGGRMSMKGLLRYIKDGIDIYKIIVRIKRLLKKHHDYNVTIESVTINNLASIKISDSQSLSIAMTKDFIQRRIIENPFVEYSCLFIHDNNQELVGYMLFTKVPDTNGIIYIAALEFQDELLFDVGMATLYNSLRSNSKVKMIRFFGNTLHKKTNYLFKRMVELGATVIDTEMYIVSLFNGDQDNSSINDELHDFSNWNINGLWTQGVSQ